MNEKSITITLSEEEYEALADCAENSVRTPEQQVKFFVRYGLTLSHFAEMKENSVPGLIQEELVALIRGLFIADPSAIDNFMTSAEIAELIRLHGGYHRDTAVIQQNLSRALEVFGIQKSRGSSAGRPRGYRGLQLKDATNQSPFTSPAPWEPARKQI